MKRILLATLVGAASHAMAQNSNERLEHVLVSVPIHKKTSETALPVTILSGQELRRAVGSNIGETLSNVPGVASASFGPGVGRPVIRGQQGARAITLTNGIAAADVSSLSPDHAVGVEPMLAESIEVLRGPSTLLYGGGAIGGVINVIDNRIPRAPIDGVQGAVEYRHDSAADMDTATVKIEAGAGDFAFHFSGTAREFDNQDIPGLAIDEAALEEQEELLGGEHDGEEHSEEEIENSDGFIANTDGDADNFTLGTSYQLGERGFVGFAYNNFETVYGIPPGSHGHEEEHEGEEHSEEEHSEEEEETIRIDLKQERYDAQLHYHDLAPGLIDVARAFLTYTDYEHVELEGAEVGTLFERETWEGRLELVREAEDHSVLGLQWRSDEFAATGDEAYVPKTDSLEWGVFYVQDFHFEDWQFEAGARVDWVERDPEAVRASQEDFTSFSLSGAAVYTFDPAWSLGLALSSSERAPATEELFSNVDNSVDLLVTHAATGSIEIGDPDLDQESSVNADLSLKWQGAESWAELTMFYNSFEDYIFLLNTGTDVEETPVYSYEQDDADFYGIELDSSFHLADIADGGLAFGLFGDYISGEFDGAGDVPRMPPRRIGAELTWTGSALGAYVRVVDADDQSSPGQFETDTAGYTRWDAGVDYRMELSNSVELLAFLKWKNISDEEIRLSTSFLRNFAPQAGESVEAGVRLTF
ncbi:MAG: iron complex outermembrane receptor protein [Halioglobus sp.]|jgi:iron complex outermembrane receptor protein